jgi:hypothetical protein
MKYVYAYKGEYEVFIPEVGMVQAGEIVTTEVEINHPLFVLANDVIKVKKQKTKL